MICNFRDRLTFLAALLLVVISRGRIDYLPDARRPWVVVRRCEGGCFQGRGRTLREAWLHAAHDREASA
jgi:hypothetical protein